MDKRPRVIIIAAVVLVAVLSVVFALNKAGERIKGVPEVTPILDVSLITNGSAEQRINAAQLTNGWFVEDEYGNGSGYVADSVHPLHIGEYGEITLVMSGTNGKIILEFSDDYPPQFLSVQRWDAKYVGMDSLDVWDNGEPVPVKENTFNFSNDGNYYVYEVYAEWEQGYSWYAFRVNVADVLDKVYLGMPNEEVYELFGEPDYQASGLMWYGYDGIGTFDPSFGFDGSIERISLANGWSWSVHDLISAAVMQQSNGPYYVHDGAYPTESHTILSLDANKDGFTVYIISLWMTFLPDGEYNVRDVGGAHSPLALTFAKSRDGDYELIEYWRPDDGTYYMPSIRSKFPEDTWNKVDTQLYIQAHNNCCYDQAMYFFVGALPSHGRFGFHKGGTAAVTDYAESQTVDDDVFLIRYFPGATLAIEEYDEQHAAYPSDYIWVIEYADPSKNITVGKEGIGALPITDDMIGVYNINESKYEIKFERYVKAD